LLGAPGADRIFHVVFFIVVASALVPGATLRDLEFPEGSSVTLIVRGEPAHSAAGIDGVEAGGSRVRAGAPGG
jgi:hypothetical protein